MEPFFAIRQEIDGEHVFLGVGASLDAAIADCDFRPGASTTSEYPPIRIRETDYGTTRHFEAGYELVKISPALYREIVVHGGDIPHARRRGLFITTAEAVAEAMSAGIE